MAPWIRALDVLAEDLGLVLSVHMTSMPLKFQITCCPLLADIGTALTQYTGIQADKTPIHIFFKRNRSSWD